jgi:hypothetical protein
MILEMKLKVILFYLKTLLLMVVFAPHQLSAIETEMSIRGLDSACASAADSDQYYTCLNNGCNRSLQNQQNYCRNWAAFTTSRRAPAATTAPPERLSPVPSVDPLCYNRGTREPQQERSCQVQICIRRQFTSNSAPQNFITRARQDCERNVPPVAAASASASIPQWTMSDCGRNRSAEGQRNCAEQLIRRRQSEVCRNYDNPERSDCENSVARTGSFTDPENPTREPAADEDPADITDGGPQPATDAADTGPQPAPNVTDPGGAGDPAQCNGLTATINFNGTPSSRGSDRLNIPANARQITFDQCSDLLGEEWSTARVTDGGRRRQSQEVWRGTFAKLAESRNAEMRNVGAQGIATVLSRTSADAARLANVLLRCESIRSMTGVDPDSQTASSSSRQGGREDREGRGGRQGSNATKKSADGSIECRSCGEQTQDYTACARAVNAYDVAMVGQVAFSGFQQLSYMDSTMDAQMNMDPNSPTAGLEAQRSGIQAQGNLATQQAGVDAAKAAAFLAMWQQIPDADDVVNKCVQDARGRMVDMTGNGGIGTIHAEFQAAIESAVASTGNSACLQVVRQGGSPSGTGAPVQIATFTAQSNSENAIREQCWAQLNADSCILMNQEARDKMKQAAILAGIESFVNMGKAALLNKQAKRISGLIDEVEEFAPQTLTYEEDDFFGSECLANPEAPGCDSSLSQQRYDFGSNEPLQIHGLSQASTFGRESSGDPAAVGPDVRGTGADRDDIATPIGTIDPGRKEGGGFVDRLPGAGQVKSGGPTGGGGGGGAGGGGGGAPPSAAGGRGGDGPRMASPTNPTVARSYAGGGGTVRLGGGGGGLNSRRPAAENENPFEGLFGNQGPTDDSLNFRDLANNDDIASDGGTSIFKIINSRYSAVRESDRLINYEMVGE